MSQTTTTSGRAGYRHKLLATASAAALIGTLSSAEAAGPDTDRPQVWLEFAGQLSRTSGQSDLYAPPFTMVAEDHGLPSLLSVAPPAGNSIEETGKLSFQPENSSWSVSASVRFGRSNGKRHLHQEIQVPGVYAPPYWISKHVYGPNGDPIPRTADYTAKLDEKHLIVDFQVGKDVGLGMFGHDGSSKFDFGVRFAQFTTKSNLTLLADPNPHLGSKYLAPLQRTLPIVSYYQFYKARPEVRRDLQGIGPSLSWSASVPLFQSHGADAKVAFDWATSFALLFGRQKVRIQHQTTGDLHTHNQFAPAIGDPAYTTDHYVHSSVVTRSHSVVVPDFGASAGISLQFPNAKVSLGYRADFFLNAIDGGIDTRNAVDRNFYGPYAAISIGFGG